MCFSGNFEKIKGIWWKWITKSMEIYGNQWNSKNISKREQKWVKRRPKVVKSAKKWSKVVQEWPKSDLGAALGGPRATLGVTLGAQRETTERTFEKNCFPSKGATPFWPKKGVPGGSRVPKWPPKVAIFPLKMGVEIQTRKREVFWLEKLDLWMVF